jgi:tryptophan synthase alpha chain
MEKRPNRITETFKNLRARGEKALVTFITAGDPDIAATKDLIFELERGGADIIELGIPFSDPMADGPTIQAASERALKKGTRLADVLRVVKEVRKKSGIPIVLFGYYNPILSYGVERYARDASRAGVDGTLIVDLPPEEAGELKKELDRRAIELIFLLTPTSDEARIRTVTDKASGFIYFVSVAGVTGARSSLSTDIERYIKKVRHFTKLPLGVGFGISTPEQARAVCRHADGVIVGSAIVNVIAANSGNARLKKVRDFVSKLKKGTMARQDRETR